MNSFNCEIFFSRCAFCDSICERTCVFASTISSYDAGVGDDGFVIDIGDVRADAVEEVAVVRDGDDDAVVGVEKSLQPVDRIEIEVVGRFVEQQSLRMAEESLRQQHADFLSALEFDSFCGV